MLPERLKGLFRRHHTYQAEFNGQIYIVRGPGTEEEFKRWFDEYAPTAPVCTSCGRIFFPGEPYGKNGDELMHMNTACCPTGSFHAGYVCRDGGLVPLYEHGESAAVEAMKTGSLVIANINWPRGE